MPLSFEGRYAPGRAFHMASLLPRATGQHGRASYGRIACACGPAGKAPEQAEDVFGLPDEG